MALGWVMAVLFLILTGAAVNLQLVKGADQRQTADQTKTKTITLKGRRGTIYDRNGLPLAYDVPGYNIEFYRDPTKTSKDDRIGYTTVLRDVIRLVEQGGGKTVSGFNITRSGDEWRYDFGNVEEDIYKRRLENWQKNMVIANARRADPPFQIYTMLRDRYKIPEDVDDDEACKLLSVWQEVQLSSYMAYLPVIVSYDVNFQTASSVAAYTSSVNPYSLAVTVGESSKRFYPRGESLGPVLGYTGRMSEELMKKYCDPQSDVYRYSRDDTVGLSGIEQSFEDVLSGNLLDRQGKRVVEVNVFSKITQELQFTPQKDGHDIVLTIDAGLQRASEKALKENVAATRKYQEERYLEYKPKFDESLSKRSDKDIHYAEMGACVVIDVRNGEILALANYPNYDPNLFIGGISKAEYQRLQDDPGRPMFNKAIASRAHPGSIFKMITAFAGLCEDVVTINEEITDEGEYIKHLAEDSEFHGPRCWLREGLDRHANQDVMAALKNSCNYYFYELAFRMGWEKMFDWAAKFGLNQLSGIELQGELQGQVASPTTLYDLSLPASRQRGNDARLTYRKLKNFFTNYFADKGWHLDPQTLEDALERIMRAAAEGEQGPIVREVLAKDLAIPAANVEADKLDSMVNEDLFQLKWTATRTLFASIGQEATMITPVAAARYAAAVANGGKLFDAHIIKARRDPNGEVIQTVPQFTDLNLPEAYVAAVKEGMREVMSDVDGTATSAFQNFKYKDDIAGKTGSAQVSDIDIEQSAWLVAFAPFDEPEIAVVTYIPNGSAGDKNAITARAVISYWMENRSRGNMEPVFPGNSFN